MSHHHDHHHDHDHDHDHDHQPRNFGAAFLAGVGLNGAFIAFEVFYGIASGSLALLADAGHNLGDVFALIMAWAAAWLSRRGSTKHHTYGLGRSSVLAAFLNAVLLLIGVGIIFWEAILRLGHPEPMDAGTVALVALIGVGVNFATALLFLSGQEDLNIKAAFVHFLADALVSLGVVAAALGIAFTGWYWLDPVTGIVISGVIVWGTWGLLRDSVRLTLDGVPAGIDTDQVKAFLRSQPLVTDVHHLHVWGLSTTATALTVHLRTSGPVAPGFLPSVVRALKDQFGIGHTTIQLEPAGTEPCGDPEC